MSYEYNDPEYDADMEVIKKALSQMSKEEIQAAVEEVGQAEYWDNPGEYESPAHAIAEIWEDDNGLAYGYYQRAEHDPRFAKSDEPFAKGNKRVRAYREDPEEVLAAVRKRIATDDLNEDVEKHLRDARPDTVKKRIEVALEVRANRLLNTNGPDRPTDFYDAYAKVLDSSEGRRLYDFMRTLDAQLSWAEANAKVTKSAGNHPMGRILSIVRAWE